MLSLELSAILEPLHWPQPVELQPVREELGVGGTAILYRTRGMDSGYEVEKMLLPKFQGLSEIEELLVNEHQILTSLSHPLIIQCDSYRREMSPSGIETGILRLEYLDGRPLSDLFAFLDSLESKVRQSWFFDFYRQFLSVIQYLQRRQMIHGDLAPENLIIQKSGYLKLIDFGVSRFADSPSSSIRVEGRVFFRAPELIESGDVSLAGDLYAAGKILEMVAGADLCALPEIQEILRFFTESRILPSRDENTDFGILTPLPDPKFLEPPIRKRAKTKISPKAHADWKWKLNLSLFAIAPFLMSFNPQQGQITVNSLPFARVMIETPSASFHLETPILKFEIPSGDARIHFVVPSQNDRRIIRRIRITSGEHLKIFEDFRNLDTLNR